MASGNEKQPLLESGADEDERLEAKMGPCCDPTHLAHRVVFLVLICFLSFGSYFVYDNPAALQNQFLDDMKIDQSQFMLMYAVYSWPNVILCFFGGYLMDKVIGLRVGALVFSGLVLLGQIIVALGASAGSYPIILAGRFVFGLGGENLAVAQNTYAVSWFKGKELNFVFGLQLSFSRVGSTVNMITMKPIYDLLGHGEGGHKALGGALWVGAMFCGLSVVTALLAAWLDKRAERLIKKDKAEVGEEINLKDILKFPLKFWLMCLICVAFYVTIFPFIGLALVFFQDKWGMSQSDASTLNSLVYIISAVASPVFGGLIDAFGRNMYWVMAAVTVTLGAHALVAMTFLTPYVAIVIMGVSYSALASSLWPMVAFVIPEHQLGTAYGFMQAVQNFGLAVISMVAGLIVDQKGYLWLETFFVAWLSLALMSAVWLYMLDVAGNGQLNLSGTERRALAEEEENTTDAEARAQDKTPAPLIKPRSNFELRNRFMSRLGVPMPEKFNSGKTRYSGPQPLH